MTVSTPFQYIHPQFPLAVIVHVCKELQVIPGDENATEHTPIPPFVQPFIPLGTLNGVPTRENCVVAVFDPPQLPAEPTSIPYIEGYWYVPYVVSYTIADPHGFIEFPKYCTYICTVDMDACRTECILAFVYVCIVLLPV